MYSSIAKISNPLFRRGDSYSTTIFGFQTLKSNMTPISRTARPLLLLKQVAASLPLRSRFISNLSRKFDMQAPNFRKFDMQGPNLPENIIGSISKQNDVSSSLANQLMTSKETRERNLVFSPLSIQLALSLLAAGSEGATKIQLLESLKCKSTEELSSLSSSIISYVLANSRPFGGPMLSCSNGVWIDQSLTLKPSFKQVAFDVYKAAAYEVDFQKKPDNARKEVNSWVEERTNSLIKDLLPPRSLDSMTRFIIANALYFRGEWRKDFDTSKTEEDTFHLINGETIKVPYMSSYRQQYISAYDGFKVLQLPFKNGKDRRRFSMCLFLPSSRTGLYSLVNKITSEPNFIEDHLPRKAVEVGNFKIPKFKIDFNFEASELVQNLGLVLPFRSGGLTEIADGPLSDELFVSSIYHKAFIEVNEKGAEAAAATAIHVRGYGSCGPPPKRLDFVADHPFFFIIREDSTGSMVFIGNLLNPSISSS